MKNEESVFDKYNTKNENENASVRQLKDLKGYRQTLVKISQKYLKI